VHTQTRHSTEPTGETLPDGALEWLRSHSPISPETLDDMPPGGGARRYWRLCDSAGRSAVFMWARREDPAILPPALARERSGLPFVEVAAFLSAASIPVPEIHAVEPERRFVVLEDLGSRHLLDLEGEQRRRMHREAIDLLARVHALEAPAGVAPAPLPFRRHFDREWLQFEARLFLELPFGPDTSGCLGVALDQLVDYIAELPRVLSLRDYQSQNLLIDAQGRLRVIDFQDALLAARGLDLASLLWDSYLPLEDSERAELFERYREQTGARVTASELAALTIHRKCKDLSRYRRLVERTGNPLYIRSQGAAERAIRASLPLVADTVPGLPSALEGALHELTRCEP